MMKADPESVAFLKTQGEDQIRAVKATAERFLAKREKEVATRVTQQRQKAVGIEKRIKGLRQGESWPDLRRQKLSKGFKSKYQRVSKDQTSRQRGDQFDIFGVVAGAAGQLIKNKTVSQLVTYPLNTMVALYALRKYGPEAAYFADKGIEVARRALVKADEKLPISLRGLGIMLNSEINDILQGGEEEVDQGVE